MSVGAQAAAKAASRTAEFATTGDWPEEEEAMYPTSPVERSLSASASVRQTCNLAVRRHCCLCAIMPLPCKRLIVSRLLSPKVYRHCSWQTDPVLCDCCEGASIR